MQRYVALLHATPTGYSVSLPDFPGYVSGGSSFEEAVEKAAEALRFHVAGMIEDGDRIPDPSGVDAIRGNPEFAEEREDAVWALVPLLPPKGKSLRLNISMDEGLVSAIDVAARERGLNRSAFLAEAAKRLIEGS